MLFKSKTSEESATISADNALVATVHRTQATIQFRPDGTILTANENFLGALGYSLQEIVGKHHSMFVAPDFVASKTYQDFWAKLSQGEFFTDRYPRITKDGATIWIQATYAPVFDTEGKVDSVFKIATDITDRQKALKDISEGLVKLRAGVLTHVVPASGVEDLDNIADDINRAVSGLADVMRAISKTSSETLSAVKQLSDASEDLSARTTSQAATLEETAAALEEVTQSVQSAAESAKAAEVLANDTKASAESSTEVVNKSISAMAEIKQSSEEISTIISVIDDIAFQTNLLALNAGVEAARAGDRGRGFAVVAAEVRALAHRSQEAAGEIKKLISNSAAHVSRGADLVNGTGSELSKIINSIADMATQMSTIATSTTEQATTVHEVNNGVRQLDMVTQKNAGMVTEISSLNSTLLADARVTSEQVERFQFTRSQPPGDMETPDDPISNDEMATAQQAVA